MKLIDKHQGFSAVELLITLFIAATFLVAGFQLYSTIIKDSGSIRLTVRASNVAYNYLQKPNQMLQKLQIRAAHITSRPKHQLLTVCLMS